ncbi:Hypothetical protein PYTT_1367 [Akkermansia glycaniphila]|uniref:Uncharacterized protein n=1 Tax=Akkermansia glycaniphila TaxID=1679444 RepID=A0A1H6LRG3_9BACT|nr:Hypothetical protein PYTT_1367 [Akkermansia glycaniphila]
MNWLVYLPHSVYLWIGYGAYPKKWENLISLKWKTINYKEKWKP